jgi:hypothetical protein
MLLLRVARGLATIESVSLRKQRFLASVLLAASAIVGVVLAAACGSSDSSAGPDLTQDGGTRDVPVFPVPPSDAAADHVAPPPPPPETTCTKYCDAVMKACEDASAQYADSNECVTFCSHLDLGDAGDTKSPSVACRAYYAASPAAIDPDKYCLAAGPFGGGVCGDRCTAYCEVALAVCAPDGGNAPFASFPECRDACAQFVFADGGEGPAMPAPGDTLNCREFQLRNVIHTGAGCADLGIDSGACR